MNSDAANLMVRRVGCIGALGVPGAARPGGSSRLPEIPQPVLPGRPVSPAHRLALLAVCDCAVSALRENQVRGIVGVFKELPCGIGVSSVGGAGARQRHTRSVITPQLLCAPGG